MGKDIQGAKDYFYPHLPLFGCSRGGFFPDDAAIPFWLEPIGADVGIGIGIEKNVVFKNGKIY